MSINTKTMALFRMSLARKAKELGTDLTGLKVDGCLIDPTVRARHDPSFELVGCQLHELELANEVELIHPGQTLTRPPG